MVVLDNHLFVFRPLLVYLRRSVELTKYTHLNSDMKCIERAWR